MNVRAIERMRKDRKMKQWEHKKSGLFYCQSRGAGLVEGWRKCESVACVHSQSSKGAVSGSKTMNRRGVARRIKCMRVRVR